MAGNVYLGFLLQNYLSEPWKVMDDLKNGTTERCFRTFVRGQYRMQSRSQQLDIVENEITSFETVLPKFLETYYDKGGCRQQTFDERLTNWKECLYIYPVFSEPKLCGLIENFEKAINTEQDNDLIKSNAAHRLINVITLFQRYREWLDSKEN